MAAKKATQKPKFALWPHKPRKPKPKPRRSDDEILAAARKPRDGSGYNIGA